MCPFSVLIIYWKHNRPALLVLKQTLLAHDNAFIAGLICANLKLDVAVDVHWKVSIKSLLCGKSMWQMLPKPSVLILKKGSSGDKRN